MQAIEKSNEHLNKALAAWDSIEEEHKDKSSEAFLEAQLAEVKAMQALAFAILALASKETNDDPNAT